MRVVTVRWCALVVAVCGWMTGLRADELRQSTSLRFVPASAAFYTSSLRLREQYDLFVRSRAFDRLQSMPFVQLGLSLIDQQYRSRDFAPVRNFLKQKENKELVAVLTDAASHEIFAYGDVGLIELAVLVQDLSNQARLGGAEAKLADPEGDQDAQQEVVRRVLQKLVDNRDKLRLAPFVIGAKVTDAAMAIKQIDRLEPLLAPALEEMKENVQVTLARTKIGERDFLTVTVDLGSIDWSEVEESIPEEFAPQGGALLEHVKSKKVTVALGVQAGYLMFSVSEGISHLQTLGEGKSLGDVPDFQRVLRHQNERVTGMWYTSPEIGAIQQQSAANQALMVTGLLRAAMESSATPDETKKNFEKDLKVLEDKIGQELAVTPHSTVGCTFLTPRGSETFQYQIGDYDGTGGTPLPILQHLGGTPLLFSATRAPLSVADYDEIRPVIGKLYDYGNTAVLSNIDEENKAEYERYRDLALPFLKRLDPILRDSLIPALADGQQAVLVEAKAASKQWIREMPESTVPLPIPELGLVLGISSADQFKEGIHGLYLLVDDILTAVQKEAGGEDRPKVALPQIEERGLANKGSTDVELFAIEIPDEAGVDKQIAGVLGVSPKYAIFTTSPAQAERALQETPFHFEGALANAPEKLLTAQHFDFAAVIDMLVPWVGYGFEIATAQSGEDGNVVVDAIHGQVDGVLEVLKCYRGTSMISYEEKGAVITHTESRFADLPE